MASLRFRVLARIAVAYAAKMPAASKRPRSVPRIEADPSAACLKRDSAVSTNWISRVRARNFSPTRSSSPTTPWQSRGSRKLSLRAVQREGRVHVGIFPERRQVSRRRGRQSVAEPKSRIPRQPIIKPANMARQRLKSNPHDRARPSRLTIADGMESDYDAIIEKKQLAGLRMMRQAGSRGKYFAGD